MREIKIIIVLMLTGKLLFAQCEYIEDSTALRVIGSASAPSCNSNFTYCRVCEVESVNLSIKISDITILFFILPNSFLLQKYNNFFHKKSPLS